MFSNDNVPLRIGKRVGPVYSKMLTNKMKSLLKTKKSFPGSRPVSFERKHLDLLEKEDYYVCERSVGRRYLMLFFCSSKGPAAYIVDHNQNWYHVPELIFPGGKNEDEYLKDTLLDGELLQLTNNWKFRVFDAMVINGYDVTQRSFNCRLGRARQEVIEPFKSKYPKGATCHFINIELKDMELAYGLHLVFKKIDNKQSIIWTPVNHPYTMGLCDKLLLWAPPEQNKAYLRITAKRGRDNKASYALDVTKGLNYTFYDHFTPDHCLGAIWKDMIPFDRIGEFRYDPKWKVTVYEQGYVSEVKIGGWRFIAFSNNGFVANNKETADRIKRLVLDDEEVTKSRLISRISNIRTAWKARKGLSPLSSFDSSLAPPVNETIQDITIEILDRSTSGSPMSISTGSSPSMSSLPEEEDASSLEQVHRPIQQETPGSNQESISQESAEQSLQHLQEQIIESIQEEDTNLIELETVKSTQKEATEISQDKTIKPTQKKASGFIAPREAIIIDDDDDDVPMKSSGSISTKIEHCNNDIPMKLNNSITINDKVLIEDVPMEPKWSSLTIVDPLSTLHIPHHINHLMPPVHSNPRPNRFPTNNINMSLTFRDRIPTLNPFKSPDHVRPYDDAKSRSKRHRSSLGGNPIVRRPYSDSSFHIQIPHLNVLHRDQSIYQPPKKEPSIKSKLGFILN